MARPTKQDQGYWIKKPVTVKGIKRPTKTCDNCQHTWQLRVADPVKCPLCQHRLRTYVPKEE